MPIRPFVSMPTWG